jgi:hypothetical protein
MDPYEIEEVFENGEVKIKTIDDQLTSFLISAYFEIVLNKQKQEFKMQILFLYCLTFY